MGIIKSQIIFPPSYPNLTCIQWQGMLKRCLIISQLFLSVMRRKKNSLSAILGVLEFKKNVGQFLKSVDIKSHCKQVFIFYDIFDKLSPNSSIHSSKMYWCYRKFCKYVQFLVTLWSIRIILNVRLSLVFRFTI